MSKQSYWELLRDPRWQRKRLEIMERDEFMCWDCGTDKVTLNVHHMYYAKGRKPWEYENESLVTLCEPCHAARTDDMAEVHRTLGRVSTCFTDRILGYLRALAAVEHWHHSPGCVPADAPRITAENDDVIEGIADALRFRYEQVADVIAKDGTFGAPEYTQLEEAYFAEQRLIAELEAKGAF